MSLCRYRCVAVPAVPAHPLPVPSLHSKIRNIFTATRTHALNLAKFVSIYKVLLLLQRKLNGGKERDLDTFIAGGLGGWWVFGEATAVSGRIIFQEG